MGIFCVAACARRLLLKKSSAKTAMVVGGNHVSGYGDHREVLVREPDSEWFNSSLLGQHFETSELALAEVRSAFLAKERAKAITSVERVRAGEKFYAMVEDDVIRVLPSIGKRLNERLPFKWHVIRAFRFELWMRFTLRPAICIEALPWRRRIKGCGMLASNWRSIFFLREWKMWRRLHANRSRISVSRGTGRSCSSEARLRT